MAISLFVGPATAQGERPNIVWFMSEDNSKHYLRHFDPEGAPAPNIESLARHGVTFDRAFSNAPVCSVARTTLITSCYAPRIGTQFHRRSKLANLPPGLEMFPEYLRRAGYYTTNRNKEDYNAAKDPSPWDDSSRKASWKNRPAQETPFFHVETHTDSHESRLHFSRQDMLTPTETDPSAIELQPYFPDTPTFRYTRARYHDRMQIIDEQVGVLIGELAEAGELENTFIFYFGDHGGVLPRSKGYAFESGLHVPLVIRIPQDFRQLVDRPLGSRTDGFVEFVDFGPTVLRLAGVDVPSQVDGKPFLGSDVDTQEVDRRNETIGYADRFDEKYDLVRTLRRGKWKYVRNFEAFLPNGLQNNYRYRMLGYQQWREQYEAGTLDPIQRQFFEPKSVEALYDLEADPHETENLAGSGEHLDQLLSLRTRLEERLKGWPDLSFFPEKVLFERAMDNPVAFGQSQQSRIHELIDTANLAIHPFPDVNSQLEVALGSEDPWVRYWALVACSCFGDEAWSLAPEIESLLDDDEPLVATRAAEFFAVVGRGGKEVPDPRPALYRAISRSTSMPEALRMLNTAVFMNDHTRDRFPIDVDQIRFGFEPRKGSEVYRRTDYLSRNLSRN